MPDPEQLAPSRADFMQSIQRCAAAYHQVKAELKKGASSWSDEAQDNQHKAFLAFAAHLPVLIDPPSFQLYVACIAQGAAIGAIDPVDLGRFCHVAQTAMSAWKLANLVLPAAREKDRAAQLKSTPLPSNSNQAGNQSGRPTSAQVDIALQDALDNLPRFEMQKQQFQFLRNRGMLLPSDSELRDNPLAALHFCRVAEQLIRQEALAGVAPQPQPGPKTGSEPAPALPQPRSQAA